VSAPAFACVGSIIIDDIVYPDGRTDMAVVGGGVTHTAAGLICWGEKPALLAALSSQRATIPESVITRVERDFDLTWVRYLDLPMIRAWQIFEWDGRRTEIWRTDDYMPFLIEPTPAQVPEGAKGAKAVTLLRHADEFRQYRALFKDAVVFWEPEQHFMVAENAVAFREALPLAEIVSPNLLEASLIYGVKEPETLLQKMLSDGARIVALRMGEQGSLVAQQGSGVIHIPAVPVPQVVDVTGAGNTYCGAFLVGWMRSQDLKTAGCYGAVAASFSVETVGTLDPSRIDFARLRDERFAWAMANSR
jgi:sugar/nucleoside kinase (ribokinase family)